MGPYGIENFCYENIYFRRDDYLVGLQDDKELSVIFKDFQTDYLSMVYLYVAGGSSLNYMGFKFEVRSREQIHAYRPHVHVIRDDVSVRYSIETFERFAKDKFSRVHAKHEKKRILPFLEENKDRFMEFWNLAMKGYLPPQIGEDGCQYCKES